MVLRVVRAEDEVPATAADAAATYLPGFVPQISLLIAVALLLLSVAVLVYFLHHIPASIRINSVLAGIGRRLQREIEKRFQIGRAWWRERGCQYGWNAGVGGNLKKKNMI